MLLFYSKRIRIAFIIVLMAISAKLNAQSGGNPVFRIEQAADKDALSLSKRSYPSVRNITIALNPDTSESILFPGIEFGDISLSKEKTAFSAFPIALFEFGYSNLDNMVHTSAGGFALNGKWGKFSLLTSFIGGGLDQPAYLDDFTDSLGVISSFGRNLSDSGKAFFMPSLALRFDASRIFNFELGYGKNAFGNGYRSLFLSETAFNYPYLKIETNVWRIKYTNLFSWLKDIRVDPSDPNSFRDKFSSTHYLNWAVSPRFNIGLFETIVWQATDTLSNRGFDPNYLNPIIFYRPVEFSIGSPDNAIIGLDLSYKAFRNSLIYGQLVFDEFLLSEFRAREGWWGNKWGAQIGVKMYDPFGFSNSFFRAEFNFARPFTFTHGSVLQNFAHFNQPLAHPLGTNFYEGILQAYHERGDWFFEAQWNYGIFGRDPDSLNFGGDIYRSYANPAETYGNETAQGIKTQLFYQRLAGGLILNRALNLRATVYYIYRRQDTEFSAINNEHIFGLRIATELFRSTTDF